MPDSPLLNGGKFWWYCGQSNYSAGIESHVSGGWDNEQVGNCLSIVTAHCQTVKDYSAAPLDNSVHGNWLGCAKVVSRQERRLSDSCSARNATDRDIQRGVSNETPAGSSGPVNIAGPQAIAHVADVRQKTCKQFVSLEAP